MREKSSDTQMRAKCAKFLNGKSIITIKAKRKATHTHTHIVAVAEAGERIYTCSAWHITNIDAKSKKDNGLAIHMDICVHIYRLYM